jgi:hypothetical protein
MNCANYVNCTNYMNCANCVWWLKMDSLDVALVDVALGGVVGAVAPGVGPGVGPVVGAVPFCWAHSLKTGWAWIGIGLDWVVLDWNKIGASF